MKKATTIIGIMFAMGILYALLLVFMPFLADTAATVNMSMNASHNMSNYPGASETMLASPWLLMFVPAIIGIIYVVIVLKKKAAAR